MGGHNLPDIAIRFNRAKFGIYSWQGQALQYDQLGPAGEIVYRRYLDGTALVGEGKATIDTLLHYNDDGHLDGILNTYPFGAVDNDGTQLNHSGDVMLVERSEESTPVGDLLLTEARRRWPNIKDDPGDMRLVLGDAEDGNRRASATVHLHWPTENV